MASSFAESTMSTYGFMARLGEMPLISLADVPGIGYLCV